MAECLLCLMIIGGLVCTRCQYVPLKERLWLQHVFHHVLHSLRTVSGGGERISIFYSPASDALCVLVPELPEFK